MKNLLVEFDRRHLYGCLAAREEASPGAGFGERTRRYSASVRAEDCSEENDMKRGKSVVKLDSIDF